MQEEFEEVAGAGLCNKFLFPTPGPDSMGNQVIVYPCQLRENFLVLWQGEGLGGVLDSVRRGFEDEGGEGRLGEEKRNENNL